MSKTRFPGTRSRIQSTIRFKRLHRICYFSDSAYLDIMVWARIDKLYMDERMPTRGPAIEFSNPPI